MNDFVGLRVRVTLVDGQQVGGVISDVRQDTNVLLLSEAAVVGGPRFPRLEVAADQIAAIDVVGESVGASATATAATTGVPKYSEAPRRSETPTWQQKAVAQGTPAPKGPSPRKKNDPGHYTSLIAHGSKPASAPPAQAARWGEVPATDFDFAANLQRFDKERIFSDIRSEDSVRPEDRLVAHNQRKVPHTEQILAVPTTDDDAVLVAGMPAAPGICPPVGHVHHEPIDAVARLMAAYGGPQYTHHGQPASADPYPKAPKHQPAHLNAAPTPSYPRSAPPQNAPMSPSALAQAAALSASTLSLTGAHARGVTPPVPKSADVSTLCTGPMPEHVASADIIAFEDRLSRSGRISLVQIAENAGRSLANLVASAARAAGSAEHVVFVVRPGRDGTIGLAAARHACVRGMRVDLLSLPGANSDWDGVYAAASAQARAAGATDADEDVYFDERSILVLETAPGRGVAASVAAAGALVLFFGPEAQAGAFSANVVRRARVLACAGPLPAEAGLAPGARQALVLCDPCYSHASLPRFGPDGLFSVSE